MEDLNGGRYGLNGSARFEISIVYCRPDIPLQFGALPDSRLTRVHPRHEQLRQTILLLSGLLNRILLEFIRRDEDVDFGRISNDFVDEFGRLAPVSEFINFLMVLEPIRAHVVPLQGGSG